VSCPSDGKGDGNEEIADEEIVPSALLIAAVVAAIPLAAECSSLYLAAGSLRGGRSGQTGGLLLIGLDALGGYVFARMAHNEGWLNLSFT